MKRIVLVIALFFSVTAIALSQGQQVAKAADNPNGPEIKFEKLVHDYGQVEQGGDGTCYFKFTNTGKEPLILQKPRSSCGCTVPTWPKTPILPGKSDEIKVTYNTKRLGNINKTVTILSNAKNGSVVLRITGKVVTKPKEKMPEKENSAGAPVNK
jgi:hypothetical protein